MEKEIKVLIVHGYGGSPNSGWRGWLLHELGKRHVYACALPMPTPDKPVLEEWVGEIQRVVERESDAKLYIVAHSLGVAATLRFLEQWDADRVLDGIILVAGPSGLTDNPATQEFFRDPFLYSRIVQRTDKAVVVHGTGDEIVPISHADVHVRGLNAKFVKIENAGHFNSSSGCVELPQVMEELLQMIG